MRSSISGAVIAAVIVTITLTASADAMALDMTCESGKRMAVFGDQNNDNVIELHWGGGAYQMQRVPTTTGAHRFEHSGSGLVWISIPAKAMLLDRKLGAPVANECRTGDIQRQNR
jgi:hypothetical protein